MATLPGDLGYAGGGGGSPTSRLQKGLAMLTPRSPSSSASALPKEDLVEFGHLVGIEVLKGQDGSQVLHKPPDLGCRWNASAASLHSITGAFIGKPGPRGIAFMPLRLPTSGGYVLGLASAFGSNKNRDLIDEQGLGSLDFAVHVVSRGGLVSVAANLDVRELGSHQGTFGTLAAGDKVEVALNEQGKVEYRVNSQVRHVSEQNPQFPLYVKCCACAPGNIVRDVRWVGPGLLETAHQHLAREEHHQRQLDHVEERLEEVASRCQAADEHNQEMFRERDSMQRSQEQQLSSLEARLTEMAGRLERTEEHYQQLLRSMERRLETTTEERDAACKQAKELEAKLELVEGHRAASKDFHAEHLASAEQRLAEHSEQLRGQLNTAEAQLAEHARRRAGEAAEEELSGRLAAHHGQLAAAEEQALQRLRDHTEGLARDAHRDRLRAAEGELAQLHRALANEHLGASEKRLLELQRALSAELEENIKRQLMEATQHLNEVELEVEPPPRAAGPPDEALKERLKQLAAIEERMRLSGSRKPSVSLPANGGNKESADSLQADGALESHANGQSG